MTALSSDDAVMLKMLHSGHDQCSVEATATVIVPRLSTPLPWNVCGSGVGVDAGDGDAVEVDVAVSDGLVVLAP